MGTCCCASVEEGSKKDPQAPEYFPADGLTEGADLILAAKMGVLCQLSYRNTSLSQENKDYEEKCLAALKITDYRIWNDENEGEIDSQALTGVIRLANDRYANPTPFVCFRGTKSFNDVISDVASLITVPFKTTKGNIVGTTGLGFDLKLTAFTKLGLIDDVMDQVKRYQSGLFVIGHSLGGAIATLFTAELMHDYPEIFDRHPITQVTFGAPRVFDKATALKMNRLKLRNLRFVNEKDLIPTLPHWLHTLYHTGDCSYAVITNRIWFTIHCTNGDTAVTEDAGDKTAKSDGEENPLIREKKGEWMVMSMNDRRFNFAPDSYLDRREYEQLAVHFVEGEAEVHLMSGAGGYLDLIINSPSLKVAVAASSQEVQTSIQAMPVEIAQPTELINLGEEALNKLKKDVLGIFERERK